MIERKFTCRVCRLKFNRSQNVGSKCCSVKCYESLKVKVGRCQKCVPIEASDGITICKICRRKMVSDNRHLIKAYKPLSCKLKTIYGKSFYTGCKWLYVKNIILKTHTPICKRCGATNKNLHVDHIKPRSKFPKQAYDLNNLQILCADCNIEKGADYVG